MYKLVKKKVGAKSYKKIKEFNDYHSAYRFLGTYMQEISDYHWSMNLKSMQIGFCKKKRYLYGSKYLRCNQICYKIIIK